MAKQRHRAYLEQLAQRLTESGFTASVQVTDDNWIEFPVPSHTDQAVDFSYRARVQQAGCSVELRCSVPVYEELYTKRVRINLVLKRCRHDYYWHAEPAEHPRIFIQLQGSLADEGQWLAMQDAQLAALTDLHAALQPQLPQTVA